MAAPPFRERRGRAARAAQDGLSRFLAIERETLSMKSQPRNPPAGPAPPEPGRAGAAGGSMLSGLLSLAAARWPWVRRPPPPPHPEPSAPRGVGAESMLSGLFSLSAAWWPWVRRIRPAREQPQRGEVKLAILTLLVHVDHYEDRATRRPVAPDVPGARSVGLPYREILKRIRAQYPAGRTSIMTIRSYARDAKREGVALPYRRPYSKRSHDTL